MVSALRANGEFYCLLINGDANIVRLMVLHSTLYTIHYTLYIIHYTLYIIHYTLYIIH